LVGDILNRKTNKLYVFRLSFPRWVPKVFLLAYHEENNTKSTSSHF